VWEIAADELDQHERVRFLEALSLREGAAESGYSEAHLGRLIAEGKIENVGKKGAPLIRRQDLPRKPKYSKKPAAMTSSGEPDLVGQVFAKR
jgi:hypothetical protein